MHRRLLPGALLANRQNGTTAGNGGGTILPPPAYSDLDDFDMNSSQNGECSSIATEPRYQPMPFNNNNINNNNRHQRRPLPNPQISNDNDNNNLFLLHDRRDIGNKNRKISTKKQQSLDEMNNCNNNNNNNDQHQQTKHQQKQRTSSMSYSTGDSEATTITADDYAGYGHTTSAVTAVAHQEELDENEDEIVEGDYEDISQL